MEIVRINVLTNVQMSSEIQPKLRLFKAVFKKQISLEKKLINFKILLLNYFL